MDMRAAFGSHGIDVARIILGISLTVLLLGSIMAHQAPDAKRPSEKEGNEPFDGDDFSVVDDMETP